MQLNYPIKFGYPSATGQTDEFIITKAEGGYVNLQHVQTGRLYMRHCPESSVVNFIKNGDWIVISSGSPVNEPTNPPFTISLATYSERLKRLAEASKAAVEAIENVKLALQDLED